MSKPWSAPILAVLLAVWAGPALAATPAAMATAPAAAAVPAVTATAETEPPDDLRVLSLTDPQRRILDQVFQRHVFESPPPPPINAPLSVRVDTMAPGGLYRLGPKGDLPVRLAVTIRAAGAPVKVGLRYLAEDFYGRKVADGAMEPAFTGEAGQATTTLALKELSAFGCYHVVVTAATTDRLAQGSCGLAVVYPAEPADPKEPFGITAPAGPLSEEVAEVCWRLGAAHLAFDCQDAANTKAPADLVPTAIVPLAVRSSADADKLTTADLWALVKSRATPSAGVFVLPPQAELEAAVNIRQWRVGRSPAPPADLTGEALAKAVTSYRAGVTDAIKQLLRSTPVAAELGNAKDVGQGLVNVSVAASPDVLADILSEGPVLAGADGISLCLGASADAPNLRSGAYARSLDYSAQLARRMGVKHVEVGETGEDPAAYSPQQQAWKLVTRNVLSLAGHAEQVYVSYGRGLPPTSAAAYAWMTHTLHGLAYQESIWPDVPLLEAHLFAGGDRSAAVIWSWIGEDPARPERGALVFDDGTRLEAHDVVGAPVGIWKGERLIVPLGEAPIYITSAELKANQLRDRIRNARILGVSSATVWVRSVAANEKGDRLTARLWVQSHRPYHTDAVAGLLPPSGWTVRQTKQSFGLGAGEARELVFDLDRAPPGNSPVEAVRPPYEISIATSLSEESIRRTQHIWPTQTPERTIDVGFGLDAWAGIDPVVLTNESGQTRAEVRTAWDAHFFYFCAAVYRARDSFRPGRYASDGDAVQLAWAPDDGPLPGGAGGEGRPLMAITYAGGGPQVVRLGAPRAFLRDHVPGNLDPWFGPVEGATAHIARDPARKLTLFEAAIPLKAIDGVRVERGRTIRFSFRIGDGAGAPLDWSRTAGVPDYLAGPGPMLPLSNVEGLPCLSLWTFTGPAPGGPPEKR